MEARLSDGSYLGTGQESATGTLEPGAVSWPIRFYRMESEDGMAEFIGEAPGFHGFWLLDGGWVNLPVPFRKVGRWATDGHWIYAGNGDSWDIRVLDPTGRLTARVRLRDTPRPVTLEDVRADREHFLAEMASDASPETRRRALDRYELAPVPQQMPTFDALVVDSEGYLWAREYVPPHEGAPTGWIVFDSEGASVGRVSLPEGFDFVYQIGADFILALRRGSYDIEQLVVHAISGRN
jgi:hypothetical protein